MSTIALNSSGVNSILDQAVALPNFLRPFSFDASNCEVSLILSDYVQRTETIVRLAHDTALMSGNLHNINITTKKQVLLQDALADANRLTCKILNDIQKVQVHFWLMRKVRKITRACKKILSSIKVIDSNLKPYFKADKFEVMLYQAKQDGSLDVARKEHVITLSPEQSRLLDSDEVLQKCETGLSNLFSTANNAVKLH